MAYSYVVTIFSLTIFILSARSIYLLAVRRQFFHLIIFLFVLRIIYVNESEPSFDQDQNKSFETVVEKWMINEVQLSRNKLNDFQSAGVCENEQNLALCVNDILFNLHNSNEENSHFKAILHLTSSDNSLIDHLVKESIKKKKYLVLLEWLNRNNLLNRELPYLFNKNLIHSLNDLAELRLTPNQNQFKKETLKFANKAKNVLLQEKNLEAVENDIFEELIERKNYIKDRNHNEFEETVQLSFENDMQSSRTAKKNDVSFFQHVFHYVLTILLSIFIWYIWDLGVTPNEILFDGVPLWKSKTEIEWLLSEEDESRERRFNLLRQREMSASNTKSVITSFFSLKGEPISNLLADNLSNLEAEVWLENNSTKIKIDANIVEVDASSNDANTSHKLQIVFSGKQVGKYIVYLRSSNQIVRGFPTEGLVIPGDADPSKSCIVESRSSTLLIAADYSTHENIRVQVNDKYGNRIKNSQSLEQIAAQLKLALWKRIDGENQREDMLLSENHSVVYRGSGIGGDCLIISMSFAEGQEGWYSAQILLDGRKINIASNLTLIVICRRDYNKIDRLINNSDIFSGSSYFEGELVSIDQQLSDRNKKSKKVFIYMTGKQVIIKEYFLKFIPMRLYTFRLTPTTKVNLVYSPLHDLSDENVAVRNQYQSYCSTVIEIDDGCQTRPQLIINDKKLGDKRNGGTLFAACFHRKMLQRLGGSETFQDKQNIFNKNLVEYHSERGNRRNKLAMKIERWCVINSSYQATKWFSDAQWINLFEIEFEGEQGIDQGGLRREWFEILCRELFSPSYKLFVQAEDGSDAVLPNPNPYPDGLGKSALKMYKFAGKIVGKCLVESAHGTTYRQQLPIRLAKSFLAQIVGLRVQYKHFCNDTPEFYSTKIHSIVNGNVDDPESGMNEMIFAEEEYDQNTGKIDNIRTVDLKPGGSRIYVTENNKYEYLDLLAQYKLCHRIKDQTTAFLDGIHRMVPDSLLTLFDEDELELLLCGIREYSLSDLKKHHIVVGGIFSGPSIKILNWFWLALSSFTTEQMARLVQFTTGSSQLPQGGFATLQPKFQIMGSGEPNSLPTAHTCFNMICLPDHNQYSHFEQALLTAITEGNEGFGLV